MGDVESKPVAPEENVNTSVQSPTALNTDEIPKPSSGGFKILIVGDSISHGSEGDYTWRYRIWQWWRDNNIPGEFVGPYKGVNGSEPPLPPQPPRFPDEPAPPPRENPTWGYNENVDKDFPNHHFAQCGYQAIQCKSAIADVVRVSKANMMLLLLGFNDVAWWLTDANGTLDSIKAIVENTRAVEPNMHFLIGNIVNRSKVEGRQDLLDNTKKFNEMLPGAIASWGIWNSPIYHVDVASGYDAGPQYQGACPAADDGLHPNALGEYQIARAFSQTLINSYPLGSHVQPVTMPSKIPARDLRSPPNIRAVGGGLAVIVTWDQVFGAEYDFRHRVIDRQKSNRSESEWSIRRLYTNRLDLDDIPFGTEVELNIRSCHGFLSGEWSEAHTVTAARTTAPPPTNIRTYPTATGFVVKWDVPKPSAEYWNISRFEVLWYDENIGGFPNAQGAHISDERSEVKGLPLGHSIQVRMRSWTVEGGGIFNHGRTIRVGDATPDRPEDLKVTNMTSDNVDLEWTHPGPHMGFLVYSRCLSQPNSRATTDGVVIHGTQHRFESKKMKPWDFEFSVSAVNGEVESVRSTGLIPEEKR